MLFAATHSLFLKLSILVLQLPIAYWGGTKSTHIVAFLECVLEIETNLYTFLFLLKSKPKSSPSKTKLQG